MVFGAMANISQCAKGLILKIMLQYSIVQIGRFKRFITDTMMHLTDDRDFL